MLYFVACLAYHIEDYNLAREKGDWSTEFFCLTDNQNLLQVF